MTKYRGSLELNWINKDKSLLYEIDEEEGVGIKPTWVEKDDIRVTEPRILKLKDEYGDLDTENMLIKGDNLLALKTLVEEFKNREESDKVKCIYIDPPFNTGSAFEHYDDNLEHSQWLTMMRDRLLLLRRLLREDGVIFIHLDNNEIGYAQVLIDEIFGRKNFLQLISVKKATTAGFKAINLCPTTVTEYILMYSKNRDKYIDNPYYIETSYNEDYGKYISNPLEDPEKWIIKTLDEVILEQLDFSSWDKAKEKWGSKWKQIRKGLKADFAERYPSQIISTKDLHKPSKAIQEVRENSRNDRGKVFVLKREKYDDMHFYNGRCIAFYSSKLRIINDKLKPTGLLTNFWSDVSWSGIAQEGNIVFKNSKKPEKLLYRIIGLSTKSKYEKKFELALELFLNDNPKKNINDFIFDEINKSIYLDKVNTSQLKSDIVLDSFLGSGTTIAVAQKMRRRYIGIEIGKHAETLCVPRQKDVITGKDEKGISKEVAWKGGGGFRYYEVGESIIKDLDMNWDMTLEEMSRAVFMNFDYSMIEEDVHCLEANGDKFYLGKQKGGIAICLVTKGTKIIRRIELNKLIKDITKKYPNQKVTIFTNMGVAVKPEELSDKLDVRKIPESILRKYRMV